MQEKGEDFGGQDEDTEIQNLPLYTERKADGIYRYRRRVPKNLVERVGKGYLYRNLGRTKKGCRGKLARSPRGSGSYLGWSPGKCREVCGPNQTKRP